MGGLSVDGGWWVILDSWFVVDSGLFVLVGAGWVVDGKW